VFEHVVGIRPSQPPRGGAKAIRSVEWHWDRPQHGQGNAGTGFIARGFDLAESQEITGIEFIGPSLLCSINVRAHRFTNLLQSLDSEFNHRGDILLVRGQKVDE
jgi:hypothetical protein